MKQKLIFCSVIFPGPQAEINSLLLAESIRAFGGKLSNSTIYFFMPDYGKRLTRAAQKQLQELDIQVMPIGIDREKLKYFFAGELTGLAQIEKMSAGKTETLAWLDANTIVLHEPSDFILPNGKAFGYRPVHHLLIGPRFDHALDPFWAQIYHYCQVPPERIFPMRPVVEDNHMRPYFNAGILLVRPEKGLLRKWCETFLHLYQSPFFQPFYEQDQRYAIFMHQAVLAGVALSYLEPAELLELPETYNYPIHLFKQDTTSRRPALIDEMVTFRHEGFYEDSDWAKKIPASEGLKQWLREKISKTSLAQYSEETVLGLDQHSNKRLI
jgi:hypothetical protein